MKAGHEDHGDGRLAVGSVEGKLILWVPTSIVMPSVAPGPNGPIGQVTSSLPALAWVRARRPSHSCLAT